MYTIIADTRAKERGRNKITPKGLSCKSQYLFVIFSPMILSKANAINGVFSVYKPKGWTSRKVTDFVQNTLSAELLGVSNPLKIRFKDKVKIGHGGTLVK